MSQCSAIFYNRLGYIFFCTKNRDYVQQGDDLHVAFRERWTVNAKGENVMVLKSKSSKTVNRTVIGKALESVYRTMDRECDPKVMTKFEYQDFLGDLKSELEARLEAAQDELQEETES